MCFNVLYYLVFASFKLAFKLLKKQKKTLKLRLLVLPMLRFKDVDDGSSWESGDSSPQVVHCGKKGVRDEWRLESGDVVILKEECFDVTKLRRPERVWICVLTACADAWLVAEGKSQAERNVWLEKHLPTLSNAVVAAEQEKEFDWIGQCRDWKWSWPESETGEGDLFSIDLN